MEAQLGTMAEWGRRHGISREAARQRVRGHNIPVHHRKIDFAEADRIWNAHVEQSEAMKIRSALTWSLRQIAVRSQWDGKALAVVLTEVLAIGAELRNDLEACEDPIRCQEIVGNRINAALSRLSEFKASAAPFSTA
jgi:hypothetical protein